MSNFLNHDSRSAMLIADLCIQGYVPPGDMTPKSTDEAWMKSVVENIKEHEDVDPLRMYMLAERMKQFGIWLGEEFKDEAIITAEFNITEDQKSFNIHGGSVTLSISDVYDYPDDPMLDKYNESIKKAKVALEAATTSAKNRKSQLEVDGKATVIDRTYKITIK